MHVFCNEIKSGHPPLKEQILYCQNKAGGEKKVSIKQKNKQQKKKNKKICQRF